MNNYNVSDMFKPITGCLTVRQLIYSLERDPDQYGEIKYKQDQSKAILPGIVIYDTWFSL